MKRTACLIVMIAALALGASAAWAKGGTLIFMDQATVNQDMVSLMDLASDRSKLGKEVKSRLAEHYVLRAPGLGRVTKVAAAKIQTALKMAKLPKDITTLIPKRIVVSRASQRLDREEIAEMYRQAVLNRLGERAAKSDIHDISVSRDLVLPAGELDVKFEFKGASLSGQIQAVLVARVNGKDEARVRISAMVDYFAPVVVAAQSMRRGHVIQVDELKTIELNITNIKGIVATDPDELVGMKVRSAVGFGQPILLERLERTPLIRRGDIVTMVVKAPGLFIRVKGKAEQTGYKNGRIRLINLATKKKVFGKVINASTVKVDL